MLIPQCDSHSVNTMNCTTVYDILCHAMYATCLYEFALIDSSKLDSLNIL